MKLKDNLFAALKQRRLSLSKLASASGVAKSTLSGWTKGQSAINLDQLRSVAKVLEIPVHELVYGEPDPFEGKSSESLQEVFSGDVRLTVHRIIRKGVK